MISEYDIVSLKMGIKEHDLPSGAKGTVLLVYDEPPLPKAYEVEFLDSTGLTLAILTLYESDIELVQRFADTV